MDLAKATEQPGPNPARWATKVQADVEAPDAAMISPRPDHPSAQRRMEEVTNCKGRLGDQGDELRKEERDGDL